MSKTILSALLALSLSPLLFAADPPAEKFEDVRARARQMGETDEGKAYEKQFSAAIAKPMGAALKECTEGTTQPYSVVIVFVIGADGKAVRLVTEAGQTVSERVAKKLDGVKLPKPPKAKWMVLVNIAIKE